MVITTNVVVMLHSGIIPKKESSLTLLVSNVLVKKQRVAIVRWIEKLTPPGYWEAAGMHSPLLCKDTAKKGQRQGVGYIQQIMYRGSPIKV